MTEENKKEGVEKVEVDAQQLKQLLADNEAFKQKFAKIEKGVEKPKRVTEHIARLRLIKGSPVVDFGKTWEELPRTELNQLNEKRLFGEFIVLVKGEDGKERQVVETVDYIDFINESERAKVSILYQKATKHVDVQDTVRKSNPDPVHNKDFRGGEEVDLEVISYSYMCEVEVIDGTLKGNKYKLDSNVLNI